MPIGIRRLLENSPAWIRKSIGPEIFRCYKIGGEELMLKYARNKLRRLKNKNRRLSNHVRPSDESLIDVLQDSLVEPKEEDSSDNDESRETELGDTEGSCDVRLEEQELENVEIGIASEDSQEIRQETEDCHSDCERVRSPMISPYNDEEEAPIQIQNERECIDVIRAMEPGGNESSNVDSTDEILIAECENTKSQDSRRSVEYRRRETSEIDNILEAPTEEYEVVRSVCTDNSKECESSRSSTIDNLYEITTQESMDEESMNREYETRELDDMDETSEVHQLGNYSNTVQPEEHSHVKDNNKGQEQESGEYFVVGEHSRSMLMEEGRCSTETSTPQNNKRGCDSYNQITKKLKIEHDSKLHLNPHVRLTNVCSLTKKGVNNR